MKTSISKSAVTSSTATSHAAIVAASPATAATPPEIANVPSVTTAQIDAFVEAIDQFSVLLGADFVVPQPEAAKRMAKPRKTAAAIVPMVADLSARYAVASTAYPTSATLAKQQLVNTLSPVAERIGAVQKLVTAIIAVGQSAAWQGSMVTYGLLKSEARGNAVLRNALAPVREKLRPTYETEDGGKTKVRSRSKGAKTKAATLASGEAAQAEAGTAPSEAAAPVAQGAAAPAATSATPATAPPAKG